MISLNKSNIQNLLKKRAVKNGMWMYLLQFFNSVIPLLTLPYITRVLGASGYGTFSKAFNLIGYFQVIVEYGFGYIGARKAALDPDKDHLSGLLTRFVFDRTLLFLVCSAVTSAYIVLAGLDHYDKAAMLALLLIPFGTIFQQNWLFQGLQQMRYITVVSVVSRIVSLIGIFLLVKTPEDIVIYSLLYALTTICGGAFGTAVAFFKFGLRFKWDGVRQAAEELKEGWYVFTTSLSSKVFNAFGITVLGFFESNEVVGIYSVVHKIPSILMLLWSPVSQILYPISSQVMSRSFMEGKKTILKYRNIILGIFTGISAVIAVMAPWLLSFLFGSVYAQDYYLAYPLLFWLVLGINNNFLGIQILLGSGHSKEYSRCFQIGILVNIVGNLLLTYTMSALGAAMAPALSELVLTFLLKKEIAKIEAALEVDAGQHHMAD